MRDGGNPLGHRGFSILTILDSVEAHRVEQAILFEGSSHFLLEVAKGKGLLSEVGDFNASVHILSGRELPFLIFAGIGAFLNQPEKFLVAVWVHLENEGSATHIAFGCRMDDER